MPTGAPLQKLALGARVATPAAETACAPEPSAAMNHGRMPPALAVHITYRELTLAPAAIDR